MRHDLVHRLQPFTAAILAGGLGMASGGCVPVGTACGGSAGVTCGVGQFCDFEGGTCGAADQTGVCASIPQACIEIFAPVCGCDGMTYSNSCMAAAARVSVQRDGACEVDEGAGEGEFCGGITGVACQGDLWCKFEEGTCGSGDQSGVCTVVPDLCVTVVDPVCGCDLATYQNECRAGQARVSVLSVGVCP